MKQELASHLRWVTRRWRHRKRYPTAIGTDIYREAIRACGSGRELLLLDRLARQYRLVSGLFTVPLALLPTIILNRSHFANPQRTDLLPNWISDVSWASFIALGFMYMQMRTSRDLVTHRLSARLVSAINCLDFDAYGNATEASGRLRSRQVALRQARTELRKTKDRLDRLAWQVSADIAVLAGDRSHQRDTEIHSRLGRLLKWVAERPYDPRRRKAVFAACVMAGCDMVTVKMFEPMSIEIGDGSVRPSRGDRIRWALLDAAVSQGLLAGVILAILTTAAQYLLKRFAGG